MHTATELRADFFAIEMDGRAVTREAVLPGWDRDDRFGIVVDSPLGAVGASHLIQLTITAFYDVSPDRRDARAQYPEIYAFHVGAMHGDLSFYDFWPPRKEVLVERSGPAVLAALNDHRITRVALPETAADGYDSSQPAWSSWADAGSAGELLRNAWLYSASGRVAEPNLTITGTDEATERNPAAALDPEDVLTAYRAMTEQELLASLPGPTNTDDMNRWAGAVAARIGEVPKEAQRHAQTLREQVRVGGLAAETYRQIDPAGVLLALGA